MLGLGGVSGQCLRSVVPVQAAADEVAQIECGGAVAEPGVVLGGAQVAEFDAPRSRDRLHPDACFFPSS